MTVGKKSGNSLAVLRSHQSCLTRRSVWGGRKWTLNHLLTDTTSNIYIKNIFFYRVYVTVSNLYLRYLIKTQTSTKHECEVSLL